MIRLSIALAISVLCSATGTASAQSAAPAPTAIPEKTAPGTAPRTNLDQKSGALSDKLSDTKGVITPSGEIDPNINKATPQTGTTPVIKPGDVGGGTAK